MSEKVMFKTTAFGGFEKRAVLNYIMELNKNAEEAQVQVNGQLREANEARQQLEHNMQEAQAYIQQLQQELDNTAAQLGAERMRAEEMTGIAERLSQEINQCQQLLMQREAEAQEAQRISAEVQEHNRELELHRQEIDQASAQIGRMIIDARTEAEQIVAAAQAEAQQIRDRALQDAREELEQISASSREAEEAARRSLSEVAGQFGQFRREMLRIQQTVTEAAGAMQVHMQDMDSAMGGVEDQLNSLAREAPARGEEAPLRETGPEPEAGTEPPGELEYAPEAFQAPELPGEDSERFFQ